jgi:hypothetical protein
VRSVLAIFAIALGGAAMAQTNLSDSSCRDVVRTAFDGIRIPDPNNLTAFSFVLRLDTAENLNGKNTNYVSALKIYDDSTPTSELLKSELTLYKGTNLIQRTVADGKRVWSYDPYQNAYSVNAYNVEQGPNALGYRDNFFTFLKESATGTPSSLITLLGQAGIKRSSWVKDWLGGLNTYDPNDPLNLNQVVPPHQFDTVWQKTPDSTRFVQFNLETFDAGSTWVMNSIQIHQEAKLGASTKVSDSFLTVPKDSAGLPMTEVPTSASFIFLIPARAKVLATARTIKF